MAQRVGFFALWQNKDNEYRATPADEWATTERIQQAFANGRSREVKSLGLFNCRWSTDRQYFTFWNAPSLEAVEASIEDLERAGDFKFADSEHIIGTLVDGQFTAGVWDQPATVLPDGTGEVGFFAAWKRKENWHRDAGALLDASDAAVMDCFRFAQEQGVRMAGMYRCQVATPYDYFTFWIGPSFQVIEAVMDRLERATDFKYADSRHIIGVHEPFFRFGSHIQNQDWLKKE